MNPDEDRRSAGPDLGSKVISRLQKCSKKALNVRAAIYSDYE